ncbi:hypothetical protein QNH36_07585 [Mesobacillus sp. AQ2]|jgi:hypothetical protein|uniref:hypothetical protein n=1 Tax=Bacillaceae TaxID=186817 RepID=UPI001642DAE9|nr:MULTISPECIES: hypothetical protein [Bacillaceae]MCM3124791.1 hypothetical protein [Mesobacillus sp. MER 33]MCM3232900.1 hypothetical protein [Mesobacillus sp. MER 48]WHX41986.1 hypothetical protein QNH36_07585 [Mesobacillus sp. AQ2]
MSDLSPCPLPVAAVRQKKSKERLLWTDFQPLSRLSKALALFQLPHSMVKYQSSYNLYG